MSKKLHIMSGVLSCPLFSPVCPVYMTLFPGFFGKKIAYKILDFVLPVILQ
jgi:hypothetical protein